MAPPLLPALRAPVGMHRAPNRSARAVAQARLALKLSLIAQAIAPATSLASTLFDAVGLVAAVSRLTRILASSA